MATQNYFDDVPLGLEIGPLARGPLTTAHLMRWSAAIENWHKIHYDKAFAVGHDNLPDLLVNGSLKQQFILMLLKDWAGPAGWVWRMRYQFRRPNVVGETMSAWARVTSTRQTAEYGLVELEVGLRGAEGQESTPGSAIVALPYRGGEPVPYPFRPPSEWPVTGAL